MGPAISIIGGAIVSATAFSGTNYAFSMLSNHGVDERKRHNRAIVWLGSLVGKQVSM